VTPIFYFVILQRIIKAPHVPNLKKKTCLDFDKNTNLDENFNLPSRERVVDGYVVTVNMSQKLQVVSTYSQIFVHNFIL